MRIRLKRYVKYVFIYAVLCILIYYIWYIPVATKRHNTTRPPTKINNTADITTTTTTPHVIIPCTFDLPSHRGAGLVFDAWFRTPVELVIIAHYHDTFRDSNYMNDLHVYVNNVDYTGRCIAYGDGKKYGNHYIYHLLQPVTVINSVTFGLDNNTSTYYNLQIYTLEPISNDIVHTTLFNYDIDLLELAYIHYTAQGFTKFIWAYNGILNDTILAQIPQHPNIYIVEWKYAYRYSTKTWQQGQTSYSTYVHTKILPLNQYVMYADLDEFAVTNTSSVTIAQYLSSLPTIEPFHVFRNRYAIVQSDWRDWLYQYIHHNTTASLYIDVDAELLECAERAKTLYHRSWNMYIQPIVNPHHPLKHHNWLGQCKDGLQHYHILNFRPGVSTAKKTVQQVTDRIPLITVQ